MRVRGVSALRVRDWVHVLGAPVVMPEQHYRRLWGFAKDHREKYAAAKPFPSVSLDSLLSEEVLELALRAFPAPNHPKWRLSNNKHTYAKSTFKAAADVGGLWYSDDALRLFAELHSAPFLYFLSILTGVPWLQPDPYFMEGGFHMVGHGGRLDPHADFSHNEMGMERRVNLLLYLNENWQKEWGGALKLYDESLTPCLTVSPLLNRCVIFNTSATSYHGHPEPMNLPEGVYRKSIALYYYTPPTGLRPREIVFPADPGFDRRKPWN